MTTAIRTRKIAGHEITLESGRRYLASRPMARRGQTRFDVKITDITDGISVRPVAVVEGLDYDGSNRLLGAFNNGAISFSGRVW